ncbi:hypothetical protein LINPERPRIM_LOCUS13668 [Linum perenne]
MPTSTFSPMVWPPRRRVPRKALVGQVIGDAPPLRVIQALANNLWGYDGFVSVSLLPSSLLLIEFPTQSLCDWVFARLWHVHNQPLLLRRWKAYLEPVDIAPVETLVWITLKGVPPPLCNHLGVGHLDSQVGKPLSKFIRVGTTVKVCVLVGEENGSPSLLVVQVAHKQHEVTVEYPEFRNGNKEWRAVKASVPGDVPESVKASNVTGDIPSSPVNASGGKSNDEVHTPDSVKSGNTAGTSKVQHSDDAHFIPSTDKEGSGKNGGIPKLPVFSEKEKGDNSSDDNSNKVEGEEGKDMEETFSVDDGVQDDIDIPRAFSP